MTSLASTPGSTSYTVTSSGGASVSLPVSPVVPVASPVASPVVAPVAWPVALPSVTPEVGAALVSATVVIVPVPALAVPASEAARPSTKQPVTASKSKDDVVTQR